MTKTRLTCSAALSICALVAACSVIDKADETDSNETVTAVSDTVDVQANPENWPVLNAPDLDPEIEARVSEILQKMTLEQKIGQVIQADSDSVTPSEVREYRLGSVLSGGNSAPGDEPYADAASWLEAADAYFEASIDPEGVEIAIPIIWGIDAVHGHANLSGATVFPHNIGLGAANNPDLIEDIMKVTAAELSLSGHDWTFAPTLAVPQDDRWGRTYEGFSEDPAIVASYADRIVYGLQGRPGEGSFFGSFTTISCAKHFVGDGGTTNGVDQGDTDIDEATMRDVHAAGYFPAIEAGVQTVMASFNSWQGTKMHGYKTMLSDVLKDRMGFNGFVVGDWNGHGQIPGCTNTDCPEAFLAGVDMYMAPDSWKGIYESLLTAVQDGTVDQSRLDDAVRRILRVKLAYGLFEKPKPSERINTDDQNLLASEDHRSVARQAVRESMVLLKNNDSVLPLKSDMTVLVIGDGADSISKQSGGWTLSWQGGGYSNSDFPNGESILEGIQQVVAAGGGHVVTSMDEASSKIDAVIAVYGEDPYAEFQGDLDHLDYVSDAFDVSSLQEYRTLDVPVVSVFLSGRPLWTNPEINGSDAFVAAWLPGTEGGGVADILFQTQPEYDFTGRLSFSWPNSAVDFNNNIGTENYAPLFPLGYGLAYGEPSSNLNVLSEDSGIDEAALVNGEVVFAKGATLAPWKAFLMSDDNSVIFTGVTANLKKLKASRVNHLAQDDAISLEFLDGSASLAFLPEGGHVDWSSALEQGKSIGVSMRSDTDTVLSVRMGCEAHNQCKAVQNITLKAGPWREIKLPLSCVADSLDLSRVANPIEFGLAKAGQVDIGNVRLTSGEPTGNCN